MENKLLVQSSPHLVTKNSTRRVMLDVLIALLPAAVAASVIFGLHALKLIAITVASSVLFEYLFRLLLKRKNTISDLSAAVTGLILALNLPAGLPEWQAVLGSLVASVVVKLLFGGFG